MRVSGLAPNRRPGEVDDEPLYRSNAAGLEIEKVNQAWSFAADKLLRLVCTAQSRLEVLMGRLSAGSEELCHLFTAPRGRVYVDTASYGLPPRATVEALKHALEQWRTGGADWVADWDPAGDDCRSLIGELLSTPADEIALLPAVSTGVAALAATLGPDDEVVIPTDEFNSLLLPFCVAERSVGARVRRVPFEGLADAVTESTTVVASSHVRSNGGGVQDLDAVSQAAREHNALVVIDATHSAGIIPLEIELRGLDVVYGAGYKHLLCPRGVAFMRLAPEHWHRLQPFAASWRSTSSPYASYFGAGVDDLAHGAARFDISLCWHAWVGARESLRFLLQVPEEERRSWCVGLASRLAEQLGVQPTGSSILGVPVAADSGARDILRSAGIVASMSLGKVRVSFHVYNRAEDIDDVAEVLRPLVV
jgi:selenocysteine lyase/cysteine desulfurase